MMAAHALPTHWKFIDLVSGVCELPAPVDIAIHGLGLDSRRVKPGDLFFACSGAKTHGERFIDEAIRRGAHVVMQEATDTGVEWHQDVPVYRVPGLRNLVGRIAERFYESPSRDLFMVGVTGTNGKTSISQFIAQGFQDDAPCGVIGTLGNGLYGELQAGTHTTPDAIELHALLDDFREQGARNVVMEVSSHGLAQERVSGVAFDVAVFSNLSHEHLDYHGDLENYGRAKQRLFMSSGLKYAVINSDDAFGRRLLNELPDNVKAVSYGLDVQYRPTLLGSDLQLDSNGLRFTVAGPWGKGELQAPLLGAFNASNLLAALAVLLVSDISLPDALQRLARVHPVTGRMERFGGEMDQPLVVVDYAHTPDALQQVLSSLRDHTQGQIWCVFGCGGDRDQAKRPLMASLAETLADRVVVTDDNPRSESSAEIISQILQGFTTTQENVEVIPDRAQAIATAITRAEASDLVLVAGKGHEDYQLIGNQRLQFSDREQVTKALADREVLA